MNGTSKQLFDALVRLLNATRDNQSDLMAAQQQAENLINRLEQPAQENLLLLKADSDTAKIVCGKQLLALVIRSSTGRWMLCDVERNPMAKVEYSTPKKAMAHYEEQNENLRSRQGT